MGFMSPGLSPKGTKKHIISTIPSHTKPSTRSPIVRSSLTPSPAETVNRVQLPEQTSDRGEMDRHEDLKPKSTDEIGSYTTQGKRG